MELKLFIAGKLVDQVAVNPFQLQQPGYLTHLKRQLTDRHDDIIDLSIEEPQFALDHVPSRMNVDAVISSINTRKRLNN